MVHGIMKMPSSEWDEEILEYVKSQDDDWKFFVGHEVYSRGYILQYWSGDSKLMYYLRSAWESMKAQNVIKVTEEE